MNNDDLEQEYSKYGIDLAEIERIIAEYTGSTVYDSPTKKEDDTPSSTPVQPEEEASVEMSVQSEDSISDEAVEESTNAASDIESVFQQRLSEAKTESMYGSDDDYSEEDIEEYEQEPDEEESEQIDSFENSDEMSVLERRLSEARSEYEAEGDSFEDDYDDDIELSDADGYSDEAETSEYYDEAEVSEYSDEVETVEYDDEAGTDEYYDESETAEYSDEVETVEYDDEAETVEYDDEGVPTDTDHEAEQEDEYNSIEGSPTVKTLESVYADFEAGMDEEDPVVEEKPKTRLSGLESVFQQRLSEARAAAMRDSDDESDEDSYSDSYGNTDISEDTVSDNASEGVKTSGLSMSDSSEDKKKTTGSSTKIDRTKLLQARIDFNKKHEETDEDIEAERIREEAEKTGGSSTAAIIRDDRNWFGRNWCWILAAGITFIFMLIFMIIAEVAPFGGNSFTLVDSMHQYVPFFSIYQEKLKSFGNMGYTWAVGGGLNFQSLLLYYMASPLNLIIIFFSRKGIIAAMSILVAVKITFSAGAFSYFLSRRKGKISCNMIITGLGVAYGLNNYMAGYFWNLMWLDCIMVLPLIVLGFERLMKTRDFRLYVLALFYSLFCNYYISFMICIFLVLWFFAFGHGRDLEIEGVGAYIKRFIGNGLRFAGASLLAAAMACFSLIMAYLAITKTASAHLSFPKFEPYGSFFDVFKAQFMLTRPITHMTYDGGINIYCGVFAVVLFFLYVISDKIDIWEKIRKLVLLAFLFVSFNNKLLNYIWHGFHDQYGIPNRFAFLFIFTLLVVGYEAVIRVKKLNPVQIISAGILSLALLFITYYKVNMATDISAKTILLVSHGMIILYSLILFLRNKVQKLYKKTTVVLGIVMALEIMVNAAIGMGKNDVADGYYHIQYTDETQEARATVNKNAERKDLEFFREDMTDYIMLDENSYNNMRGLGTFCSTVRGDMVTAMGAMGYYTGANEYLYMGSTPMTDNLLGVRYIYSRGESYYPSEEELPVVYESENLKVYENTGAYSIAYQVNDDVAGWDLRGPRVAETLNRFAWLSCGNSDIFDRCIPKVTISGTNCTVGISNDNPEYISYDVTGKEQVVINILMDVEKSGRYYMNLRGNYIDKVAFSLNGEEKSKDRNYIQMFDMGNLKVGDSVSIDIIMSDDCSTEGSLNFFLHTLNRESLDLMNANITEKPFTVEEFKDGYVKGKIEMSKGKILMTSIPYDEGWTVYDNGQKIDTFAVGGAFLAVSPGSGVHELEFKFTPDGLKIGVIVSVIAWIIFFILYIVRRRLTAGSKEGNIRR